MDIAIQQTTDSSGLETHWGPIYGVVGEFETSDALVEAARRATEAGYRKTDAFTPIPIEGLDEAMHFRDLSVPIIMFIGGVVGCIFGFLLQYYCMVTAYTLNVAGRPLYAWPQYIPVTFECTVLFAALSGILAMFMLNGLPQPYHPIFDTPNFDEASSHRFFLSIEAKDPKFDIKETKAFMESLGAAQASVVHERK